MSATEMKLKAGRSSCLQPAKTHYCPGCGHGTAHRLLVEVLAEEGLRSEVIGVAPVGCAVVAYNYMDVDMVEAAHGRAPEVAVGIKRVHPEKIVFTYQGDGDLAAIGTSELIHVANRGEFISIFFVNNICYGMTGGQMAPTTLIGQKTSTTPYGRDPLKEGPPIRVSELLAGFERVVYLERCMLTTPKAIRRAKAAIRKSINIQRQKKGFSLVEMLSPCPTYWRMTPPDCVKFIEEQLVKIFPPGLIKDTSGI